MEKKSKLFGLTPSEIKHEHENPEVTISNAFLENKFLLICWTSKIGFGQFHFTQGKDGQLLCTDNENMSPVYVKAVLQKWIDGMKFDPILIEEQGKWNSNRLKNLPKG